MYHCTALYRKGAKKQILAGEYNIHSTGKINGFMPLLPMQKLQILLLDLVRFVLPLKKETEEEKEGTRASCGYVVVMRELIDF